MAKEVDSGVNLSLGFYKPAGAIPASFLHMEVSPFLSHLTISIRQVCALL